MSKRLVIASSVNFLRAYGGIRYLADALVERGVAVEVYQNVPKHMLHELSELNFPSHSYASKWYGRIPRVRRYLYELEILLKCASSASAVMICEMPLFPLGVILKKWRRNIPFIHYCQELITQEDFAGGVTRGLTAYQRFADIPDMIIDVEPHRAEYRQKIYGISQPIAILPNTVPLSEIPSPAPKGTLSALAGGNLPEDMPVLLYAGGVHFSETTTNVIVEALQRLSRQAFFLAFLHGPEDKINGFKIKMQDGLGSNRCRICNSLPRRTLLSAISEASAGLVYYPYSDSPSINQLYCAPTKAMEYIGAGLPVISSANPSMRDVLEKMDLGVCAEDDSPQALARAIESVIFDQAKRETMSERQRRIFAESLCFEKVAEPVIERILRLLQIPSDDASNVDKVAPHA